MIQSTTWVCLRLRSRLCMRARHSRHACMAPWAIIPVMLCHTAPTSTFGSRRRPMNKAHISHALVPILMLPTPPFPAPMYVGKMLAWDPEGADGAHMKGLRVETIPLD